MKTALILALVAAGPQISTAPESPLALDPLAGALPASHCTVSYTQCSGGQPISCTGHVSCQSGAGWVECDGQRTTCGCTVTCQTAPSLSCTSEAGDCQTGWVGGTEWIGCDGDQLECVE